MGECTAQAGLCALRAPTENLVVVPGFSIGSLVFVVVLQVATCSRQHQGCASRRWR